MSPNKNKSNQIGIVLLAAGASKRLGRPKQLLTFSGNTFLQNSLKAANSSQAFTTIVVLGSDSDSMVNKVNGNTHVIINPDWQEGMASSIRNGIKSLLDEEPSADGVILMMVDQPYVDSVVLNNLIEAHKRSGKPIVACAYQNTFGPPALFHKSLFSELLQLYGDIGARSVVKQHADDVEVISFPKGEFDIDTEADYEKLSKR